jgi:hypothetical protein
MVETGFTGFGEPGSLCDSYLLSQRNIALSTRLTHVESVLGTLVTGAANRCIGVIGGAEVDAAGNVNSTWSNGKLVVGSGGACDIALGAREVVVLARTERLVAQVEYITSPGARVRAIVIEHGVLERTPEGWQLLDLGLAPPVTAPVTPAGLDAIPWPNLVRDAIPTQASSAGHTLSADEHDFIQALRAEAASLVPEQRLPLERTAHVKGEQCTPSQ